MDEPKKANVPLINFALGFAGGILYNKAVRETKHCRRNASKTLRKILDNAKDTDWGKAHNFADILKAKNDEELFELYRKNQPETTYEDIRPLVERHKHGESDLLFPGKPKMYATTSGTTKEPKWIPITNEYYDGVYNKMTKIWLYTFMKFRPGCWNGPAVSIVGKAIEGHAPDGTVYGSVSGVTRRDVPEFIKPIHSAPAEVFDIIDYTARYYTIMRIGIEQDAHVLITANPSTIVEMQNNVNLYFEDYCNDIETGTLSSKFDVPEHVREALKPYFKPNPKRAAELRALKEKYPTLLPKHYWPRMKVLVTWKCGNTTIYMDKFKNSFPEGLYHQEFTYLASECRAGLILDETDNTVLCPQYHYFEFVSMDEIDNPNKKFYQIYELEVGKYYAVYVTTYAGLYRYNMNDMIKVTGMFNTVPTIQFVQKINGIISMTGEKLHETQFMEAVSMAEKETGIKTKFFIGFADVQNSVYQMYYEFEEVDLPEDKMNEFNTCVDAKLKEVNIEYAAKRDSLRIKLPIPHALQKDSYETYKERCILAGGRDGQFKLVLLNQDENKHEQFKSLMRK